MSPSLSALLHHTVKVENSRAHVPGEDPSKKIQFQGTTPGNFTLPWLSTREHIYTGLYKCEHI